MEPSLAVPSLSPDRGLARRLRALGRRPTRVPSPPTSSPFTLHRLLRTIEHLRARGLSDGDPDYAHRLREAERRAGLSLVSEEAAEKDRLSHFILRLAYCRSEDLRAWFLAQETHLLRHRLEGLSDVARLEFMRASGVEHEQLSPTEAAALGDKLQSLTRNAEGGSAGGVFKVPFTQALPLVAAREVLLVGGFAYVPLSRLVATIVAKVDSSHSLRTGQFIRLCLVPHGAVPRTGRGEGQVRDGRGGPAHREGTPKHG